MLHLNYKKYGSGIPLIIIHGFTGSLDNWHTLATEWGKNGLEVYTLDMRNHGRSPHTEDHSISLMAEDAKDFLSQQNISKANFLGHSMGGKVVMELALKYPALVDKLIVVDISPREYKRLDLELFDAIKDLEFEKVTSRKMAEDFMKRTISDMGSIQFFLKNLERKDSGEYAWKFNYEALLRNAEEMIREISSDHPFKGDTLFIKGEFSNYIREKDFEPIKKLFPNSRIETIKDAGHWVHADKPK
ncbi:MAG: alpha/beta fold hydrolase, partial [Bacteroidia bacterium]